MCGINGIYAYQTAAEAPRDAELIAARDHMRARGPDGFGAWRSEGGRCALGHRRLAIVDPTPRGAQPMVSAEGLAVTFNGEIYNFPQLRLELEAKGRRLSSACDTEALLHLYALHGEDMVHHLRGMYAFAIWDPKRQGLFLARDPYGIKPLYTANDGWTFRFASQVKALLAGGAISRDPEPAGIVGFHLWGSTPEPYTLWRDIRALPAGHSQWIDQAGPREPRPFVRIAQVLSEGARHPAPAAELEPRVRAAALDAVRAHLMADVEVGVFLSAGIDSGAILGLMADAGQARIRAITLAYDEFAGAAEDESPLAAAAARLYGAEHVVRRVCEREFRDDLPAILEAMDQPSIDGVNTWFVSKAAREAGLKVALSGLGGDELLAGYPSFRDVPAWAPWLGLADLPGLAAAGARLAALFAPELARARPKALGILGLGGGYPGAYLLRRGLFLPQELTRFLDRDLVRRGLERLRPLTALAATLRPSPGSPIGSVCALESAWYLKNQLLRDADWAGMAHSLEIRTPLVDIAALTALAPLTPRLTATRGKRALALSPSVPLPEAIIERAKTGFGVPGWYFTTRDGAAVARPKGLASRARALDVLARFNEPAAPPPPAPAPRRAQEVAA